MGAKEYSSLSLHRRFSCSQEHVTSEIVSSLTKGNRGNGTRRNSTPVSVKSKDTHTYQIPTNSSLFPSTQELMSTRVQPLLPFAGRTRSTTSLPETSTYTPSYTNKSTVELHPEKNEAEIINDLPINLSRWSYSGVPSTNRRTALNASRTKFTSQWNVRMSVAARAKKRQFNTLHRNSVDEKLLQQAFRKLDRQSLSGALEIRQKLKEVVKDYKKVLQRSPSTNEWHLLQTSRVKLLQDREKKRINRIFSRQERNFRAPPHLSGIVSEIKWQTMIHPGLLDTAFEGTVDDPLVEQVNHITLSRRHTVSGDNLEASDRTSQHIVTGLPCCRRMTLTDIKAVPAVLKPNVDCNCKFSVDFSRLELRDAGAGEQNSTFDCEKS